MTKEDINKLAFIESMPDIDMTCPERCLWYALRDVYRQYRSGEITVAQGDAAKHKAIRQYEIDAGILAEAHRIIRHHAAMWMEIELAASAYSMNRTLQNADAFISAVYGVQMKSVEDLEEQNMQKVQNALS